ncbi:MAG: thioredoxin-dependent thiol peroxidase [Candidatus Cohnella colombiensis]|uniref:thioredoxin-dependent peroxiredoxin n=1 Tax=Candidatus Cohnella colombiensis TaxID=3121368 RepID=A0AA95EX88_9BACL|nr:MAG: thioredoxin-dependent thiol peroxidase [Cohnella sp.]
MSQLQIGKKVPDFKLLASNGETVKLSDFRDKKVILYFYPKDLTTACTQQACDFRDANETITIQDTVILGISTDDLKQHNKFIEKYELPFILLSDPNHKVCEKFGVWQEKKLYGHVFMGIVRSTFLIDEKGKLLKEWRNIKVKGHVEKVVEELSVSKKRRTSRTNKPVLP